ncbi:5972_t:CDS:2 [Ambispora leptoticha]|uniref:5972_t:CDS:1 n=1 Tax=Ambispora leptoticha TaxID=144679 RepID=A0A9N9BA69_9GLOM|nr:5972_t:CDS:2 [Ambispora leptoticha]
MEELEKGTTFFTQVHWQIHRPNVHSLVLRSGEYKIDKMNKNYIKCFSINDKNVTGISCFVPLETPHNVPTTELSEPEIPCYFLPENMDLPEGLALFYTHKMKLRFPSNTQTGLHFVIAPTIRMTKNNYVQAVKNLNWHLCTIKAAAKITELVCSDDDLDGVEDARMVELYWLTEIWYEKAMDAMDRIHAIDIHTWIALEKPSFQDLLQHESRAHIVFSALIRMKVNRFVTYVTELMHQKDILGELKNAFGRVYNENQLVSCSSEAILHLWCRYVKPPDYFLLESPNDWRLTNKIFVITKFLNGAQNESSSIIEHIAKKINEKRLTRYYLTHQPKFTTFKSDVERTVAERVLEQSKIIATLQSFSEYREITTENQQTNELIEQIGQQGILFRKLTSDGYANSIRSANLAGDVIFYLNKIAAEPLEDKELLDVLNDRSLVGSAVIIGGLTTLLSLATPSVNRARIRTLPQIFNLAAAAGGVAMTSILENLNTASQHTIEENSKILKDIEAINTTIDSIVKVTQVYRDFWAKILKNLGNTKENITESNKTVAEGYINGWEKIKNTFDDYCEMLNKCLEH